MNINKNFNKENEKLYLDSETLKHLGYIRGIFLLFILFYALFFIVDILYLNESLFVFILIRFFIVIPILLTTMIISFTKHYYKLNQYIISLSFFAGGSGIAYMLILIPENIVYYGGLFIVIFSGYLLIRLRFIYATFAGSLIIFFYMIAYLITYKEFTSILFYNLIFFLCANTIGLIGVYNIERTSRQQFLNNQEINDARALIKQQYDDKNEKLKLLESSINENKVLHNLNIEKDNLAKSLRESEQRFKILHNASFGGIAVHDQGVILDCNQGLSNITGFQMEELIGMNGLLLIAPDYREFVMNKIITKYEQPYEAFGIRKNNEIYPLKLEARNLPYQGKEVRVVEFRDITEINITNKKLMQSEEQYRLLSSEMQLGLVLHEIICDDKGKPVDYRFISVNNSFERLTGLKREDIVGKTAKEVLPEIEEYWIEAYGDVALTGKSIQFENYSKELGKYFNTSAYSPKKGQFAVIVEDITERVLIEKQRLKDQTDLLNSRKIAKLGTWRLDIKTNKVTWSEELYKMYGFDPTQPVPPYTEHMKLFTKQSWEQLSNALELTSTKGIPYELELEMAINDVPNGWMWVRGEAEYDDQGQIISLSGAAQNITELKKQKELKQLIENQLSQVKTKWHFLNQRTPLIFDDNGKAIDYKFLSVNDSYENMIGLKREEIIGKRATDVLPDIEDMWINKYAEVVLSDKTVVIADYSRALGKYFKVVAYPYIENQFVVIAEDITEKRIIEEENIHIANHDYLTNLHNRRYFVNAFKKFNSHKDFPLGLMMIDINGLKIINDAYGHFRGDEAIKQVANLLLKVFDQYEVVARIDGDEFAILSPHKNAIQLQDYKDKLVLLSQDIKIENIPVSLAIGFEILNDNDNDFDELLSRAEKQLYRHKITVGESIRNHAIKAILNTLTDKYKEEKIHSEKVSLLCKQIGTKLGLNKEDIDILELAGMYHDIGKISIPDAILNKPSRLTDEEYDIIKTHTQIGYQILRAADEYSGLAEYALSHHERWDGRGYPKGLKGKDIPLFSRIINVADSFEAMTADRPYRKGMPIEDAIAEIKRCSGSQFDPKIANIFLEKVLK